MLNEKGEISLKLMRDRDKMTKIDAYKNKITFSKYNKDLALGQVLDDLPFQLGRIQMKHNVPEIRRHSSLPELDTHSNSTTANRKKTPVNSNDGRMKLPPVMEATRGSSILARKSTLIMNDA